MGRYFSLSNLQCDVKSLIGVDIELSLRGQIQICRRCTCVGGGAQFELVGIRSCRLPPTWSSDPRRTFFNLSIQGFPIHTLFTQAEVHRDLHQGLQTFLDSFRISRDPLTTHARSHISEKQPIRPERWIVTIPSLDQWLATIGNH